VREWEPGRLDANAHVLWSSQALCVSVFGSIAESPHRDELVATILTEAGVGLGPSGSATLDCEVRNEWGLLRERGGKHPTCPDVLVSWPDAVMTIESKFTEQLDGCGQLKPSRRTFIVDGKPTRMRGAACSGNYEPRSDLTRKMDADVSCRLTVAEGGREARRYWELAPRLFKPECIETPQRPCPFARTYQLMWNLSFAAAWAERGELSDFGLLLAYVGDAPNAAKSEALFRKFRGMLLPSVAERVGSITYERIAKVLGASGRPEDGRLRTWIAARLSEGLATHYG
jgi:Restriction Endonuclease associating with ARP